MHWLKNSNPELFNRLVKAAGITDAQRQAYLERTGRTDLTDDAAIDEEIICDQMEDVASRTGLLQNIAGKNRGLIEHVVAWLQDTFKKFRDFFRNPQGGLTTKQSQALADEFGRIANQLVDPSGEKIFRYNRSTHTVELADGRTLTPPETKKAATNGVNPKADNERVKQKAQELLKAVGLENRRPKSGEKLGKVYGQMESDGTFTAEISKGVADDEARGCW